MKNGRLLPETDLARSALLPDDQKRIVLRGVKTFKPPYSFTPVRKTAAALYEARSSLIALPTRTWPDIEAAIRSYCKNNSHWVDPNLEVARALFDFNQRRALKAVEWEFGIVPVGFGAKIKFWHDFYSIQDGGPVLSFIDPRLTDGVTPLGRIFMFSAMRHKIAIGDFEDARLEIIRFPRNRYTGKRDVEVFTFDDRDVVDENTLNEAIDRTYKIWWQILAERTAKTPPATGTEGGFDF
jgi:hypothetical protein